MSVNDKEAAMQGIFIPQTLNLMQLSLLPTYRGEGGIQLNDFLERIEDAAKQFCWSDSDKFFVLKNRLFEEAREIINENREEAITYEGIVKILRKNFGKNNGFGIDLFNFMGFRQPANMPVDRFIAQASLRSKNLDFGAATKEAADKQREHMLFNMLKSNIKPEILRGVLAKDPQNLEELKNFAILEENAIKMTANALNPFLQPLNEQVFVAQCNRPQQDLELICERLTTQVSLLTEKIEKLEKNREQKWERNKNYPRRGKREIICFRCNLPGHIARSCTTPLGENPEGLN